MSSSNMPSTNLRQLHPTEPERAALARWENEGGALRSEKNGTVREPGLAAEEIDVLHSLGSGVLALWAKLPTAIQRELFQSALSGHALADPARMKWQIARFLHRRAHADNV